jgi:phosphocarrier protein
MVERSILINNKTGLHARPASNLVKAAKQFQSKINIIKDDRSFEAKSMLAILSAGIVKDTKIRLVCEGEDEEDALKNLTELIESNHEE